MKKILEERLIRYCQINTRSDANSSTVPSTKIQFDLARILYDECIAIGLDKVKIDEYGIVTALLPSNSDKDLPTVGFIAHVDTADYNSENVQPRVIENYDGKDIVLNEALKIVSSVDVFPNLLNSKGDTIIVTDGTTLLGADNKAGVAEIMTAMEYLIDNDDIEHGDVRIAFTIDEEIGTGSDSFDVEGFNADFAYTVDGGSLGGLEYETFNAAAVEMTLHGVSVHPGSAKDQMINTAILAMEVLNQLPADQRPENTEGRQGFFLVTEMTTNIEKGSISMIIRDHDMDLFQAKKDLIKDITLSMNEKYGYMAVETQVNDTYYNMKNIIEKDMSIVEIAQDAMKACDVTPVISAVRGGTDGSRLSYMGLPTPNLFTGGENFHGRHEFVNVDTMVKATEVIITIAHLLSQQ